MDKIIVIIDAETWRKMGKTKHFSFNMLQPATLIEHCCYSIQHTVSIHQPIYQRENYTEWSFSQHTKNYQQVRSNGKVYCIITTTTTKIELHITLQHIPGTMIAAAMAMCVCLNSTGPFLPPHPDSKATLQAFSLLLIHRFISCFACAFFLLYIERWQNISSGDERRTRMGTHDIRDALGKIK